MDDPSNHICEAEDCNERAVVGLNGTYCCLFHFQEGLGVHRDNVERLGELVNDGD